MKNSIIISLIICGTFLIIVPFIHNSISAQQVVNTMALLKEPVHISSGLSRSYYMASTIIGAIMVLAGILGSAIEKLRK
jgi:hypothetical protein